MSGGRATVAARRGATLDRQAGDISATSIEGHRLTDHFYVECKHLKSLDVHGLIQSTGMLLKVWQRAVAEANRYGRSPMLIARQNRMPIVVGLSSAGVKKLGIQLQVRLIQVGVGLHIVLFDDLLEGKPL